MVRYGVCSRNWNLLSGLAIRTKEDTSTFQSYPDPVPNMRSKYEVNPCVKSSKSLSKKGSTSISRFSKENNQMKSSDFLT